MKRIVLFATVVLAGCGSDPVPAIMTQLATVDPPRECSTSDPKWTELPDADVKRSEAARNYQTNKEAFNAMRYRRSICRAGVEAAKK
ncbi:hypothetical protein [Hyphomicrobium sp. DY-1]|uniref:hypothetical protein n=1 Tax=Hyphomicrobium sp. DY-1 TaxID=3075650 RepID=UPI0039C2B364